MSHLLALNIALWAGNALAASSLLFAVTRLAADRFSKRAGLRHVIWLAMFAILLALPLLALATPGHVVLHQAAPALAAAGAPVQMAGAAAPPPLWAIIDLPAVVSIGLAVWLAGVGALAVRAVAASGALRSLRERSVLHEVPSLNLPASASGARAWELRLSGECSGPITWGILRPVVLLPWNALSWSDERTCTVLRHELAHVRRRDSLAQALALLACALYWPNPLVWLAARALRREAEIAADDVVIASGVRPSDYADELLRLAREMREQRLALAMAAPWALSQRVNSVLSPTPLRTGVTAMDVLKVAWIGAATTAALAIARPGIAETPRAPVPLPAPVPAEAPAAPDVAVKPLPPAAAVSPATPTARSARTARVHIGPSGQTRPLTAEDQAALDRELAKIGPTIDKAIADAHIDELVARQVTAENARTQAEVARQMAEIGPRIQKAVADAHIAETVAKRMAEVQPRIDAAVAKAQAAAEKARERADRAQVETN